MTSNFSHILKLMFIPALRYCLRNAISLNLIQEVIKETFVELAILTLEERTEKVTASRVSIMTGVHRPDVRRILAKGEIEVERRQFNLIARVLSHWEQGAQFQDRQKKPKTLSINQFQTLVESITKDVGYRAVLDELNRLGYIEKSKNGYKLCQVIRRFDNDTIDQGYGLLAKDNAMLCEAVEENLLAGVEPRNLHAKTLADNIYLDAIPQIRAWLLQHGSKFHQQIREYLAQFDKDLNPDPHRAGGGHVTICAFSHTNPSIKELSVTRK